MYGGTVSLDQDFYRVLQEEAVGNCKLQTKSHLKNANVTQQIHILRLWYRITVKTMLLNHLKMTVKFT
jgi:hypothetical protein